MYPAVITSLSCLRFWPRAVGTDALGLAQLCTVQELQVACLSGVRSVIGMQGPEAVDFLQGMVTNDVRGLHQPGAEPVYAALMTPKGKFLHDVFVFRQSDNPDSLLLDVDAQSKDKVFQHLKRYRLRRKFDIVDSSSEKQVWAWPGGARQPQGGWHADPRLPELGLRGIFNADSPPASAEGGGGMSSAADAYKHWRMQLGVADGDSEIPSGSAAPLEYNLDVLRGVSFTKGCYVGQERNSYAHFRGVLRRRLVPARLARGATVAPGEEVIMQSGAGGAVGTVRGVSDDVALVHARVVAVAASLQRQEPWLGGESGAELVPFVPGWWPSQWLSEEMVGLAG